MSSPEGRSYDPQKDAAAQEPLTQNELKLVTRLFGDPFAFPLEFKAWLRGWLEEQFPRLSALSVSSSTGAGGTLVPPAGAILDFGGDVAPGGYVMCNGAEYNKTLPAYQALFSAIGYKYGQGATTDWFKVPDFQGRMAVGKGSHADVDTMGDSEGQPVHLRSAKHAHSVGDPGHSHSVSASGGTSTPGNHGHVVGATQAQNKLGSGTNFSYLSTLVQDGGGNNTVNTSGGGDHGHSVTVSGGTDSRGVGVTVGPGSTPVDSPGYLVVNKIISLGA